MDGKTLLACITESVDEKLRLRNEYLVKKNHILRQQSEGRVQLTDVVSLPDGCTGMAATVMRGHLDFPSRC